MCEALVEFALSMRWFATAARAVKLCQGIKGRCWEDDTNGRVLQQLRGLGEAMAKKLASCTPPVANLNELGKLSVGKLEVPLKVETDEIALSISQSLVTLEGNSSSAVGS